MVTITDTAVDKIVEILKESECEDHYLRTFVQGGGCSGFQYGFQIDEAQEEDDFLLEKSNKGVFETALSLNQKLQE